MPNGEIVDIVDVSDVCGDIDKVTLHRVGSDYQAAAFVEDPQGYQEVGVDLTEYPAVVAIASRAFETDRPVSFDPPRTITPDGMEGSDVD